ncbi:16S rRNA pseudouridine(516) synthase [Listeria newyorkensis]|uniref:Pseudouridine synthase n=1 Tax=Listeria newyorkensis TaxID=1497681 RepID=A0ABX4XQW5_9LIST|nr:pseudouridine synthase [Listeria newyorkensis]PNP94888.1 16S rRNA pseudouridine(516) synthase [Listeria newyorkensis]WAO21837.1 pseudouridine synthase [Listeria newyorkensis]
MRLDKLLANSGFGSRTEVKQLLKNGAITVNDVRQKEAKFQVDVAQDSVEVYGETVVYEEFTYLMMNKPPGVVSATEDNWDQTVIDLLEERDRLKKLFPVGRLDKDTEGLLLISNNGVLAHNLLSPKKHVDKTYFAKIEGAVTEADIAIFRDGVTISDNYTCKSAELVILQVENGFSDVEVTIQEGKFHQVKRMFEAVDKQVVYLKRLRMGALHLDETLALGEYRPLTPDELAALTTFEK